MTTPTKAATRSAAEVPPKAAKGKSTGPRTVAGRSVAEVPPKAAKRRSSRNAIKHGILSVQLIPDDRPEERDIFDAMHEALIEEYAPATMMETYLVERTACRFL